jgi:hypothetical protein
VFIDWAAPLMVCFKESKKDIQKTPGDKNESEKLPRGHQEDLGLILLASQARKLSLLREHTNTWPCPENFNTMPSPEVMLPTKLPKNPRLALVEALKPY